MLPTESVGRWRSGGCPSIIKMSRFVIHVDTGFLLVTLSIRPFAKIVKNENNVEFKGILKISRLVSNYFYIVLEK